MATVGSALVERLWQMGQAGQLWQWDPLVFAGLPVMASTQGAVVYPLHWIFFWLRPLEWIGVSFLLHQGVAYAGTYRWLRELKLHPWACAAGALSYALGPARLFLAVNLPYYGILSWAPWMLASVEQMARRPGAGGPDLAP